MKRYQINLSNVQTLPIRLGVTQTAMAQLVGMSAVTMSRRLQDGNFKVSELLLLCRTFKFPVSYLVTTEEQPEGTILQRQENAGQIRFCTSRLHALVAYGVTYKEMMRRTKYSRTTLQSIGDGNCSMEQLLAFCNRMRINLRTMIRGDEGLEDIEKGGLREENKRLKLQIQLLQKEIEELRQRVEELGGETRTYVADR